MKLVSVYDTKAQAFLHIATTRTSAEAIRQFESAAQDPKSQFNQFPNDFILYELAEYNELTAEITPHAKHLHLAVAADFINKN